MKLKFIFLGKKKIESSELSTIYLKRLKNYINYELIFINEKNIQKSEKRISNLIKPKDYLISLDERGDMLNSQKYAFFLHEKIQYFHSIVFVVGEAYGIPDSIIKKSAFLLSLSKMTLPHIIARLVLIEQIYRAFTIMNKHPYHHDRLLPTLLA